jgi:hypothetical protein
MGTAVKIDPDVLEAALALARDEKRSVDEVVSELARQSLQRLESAPVRNGLPLLPRGDKARPVTLDIVNALRDELS